jgi:Tfp pilus assembly protein PilX
VTTPCSDSPRRHSWPRARRATALGVSLIEALVALAVMAFGILGVVGMQATLRYNGDISRQRAEAVRLAQEEIERLRNHSVRNFATGGPPAFDQIVDAGPVDIPVTNLNTLFQRSTEVVLDTPDGPKVRGVRVFVTWRDRRDAEQTVVLSTSIGWSPPALMAAATRRADQVLLARPDSRNINIPRGAVAGSTPGTSQFDPPGSTDVRWIFNNDNGIITETCSISTGTCTPGSAWLVSGSIGFGTLATNDTELLAAAELPSNPIPSELVPGVPTTGLSLSVRYGTAPSYASSVGCFLSEVPLAPLPRLQYYCAIPVSGATAGWRGNLVFGSSLLASATDPVPTGPAASPTDPLPTTATATLYRICRYTPEPFNYALSPVATASELPAFNARNPWRYFLARQSYTDRNFLVIKAGDGSTVYQCPSEDIGTPIQSGTRHHARFP